MVVEKKSKSIGEKRMKQLERKEKITKWRKKGEYDMSCSRYIKTGDVCNVKNSKR